MSCFVIAEAGVNHNGSIERALALVEIAAEANADAVKFQTFRADRIVAKGTRTAAYQERETGESDQHTMIRQLELSEDDHRRLAARCAQLGIEFMSTPFDEEAAELLLRLGVRRLKIASGELNNRPFLEHLARCGLPLILSTGMGSLEEVGNAVAWITASSAARRAGPALTLLHCTSNYPAMPADVNLLALQTMANAFGLPVGYSDHTLGIAISLAAVAMGATVIEKHFTADKSLPGPDHRASLSPAELAALVAGIRDIEQSRGDGIKRPRPSELPIRDLVRRSAFLTRDLAAGAVLSEQDVTYLRPGTGIGPDRATELVGRELQRAITAGAMLSWSDLK